MASESQSKRIPKPEYFGRNGFLIGPTDSQVDDTDVVRLTAAVDRHRNATYILQRKKRALPSFDEMKTQVEQPDDSQLVKERIKRLRLDHHNDLSTLYEVNSAAFIDEIVDQNASKTDIPIENPEAKLQLDSLYSGAFRDTSIQLDWSNGYEQLRYTYLSQLIPLRKQQLELERQEQAARKRLEQQFPQSKEDFDGKPDDVKLRAARFLVLDHDRNKQEKMLSQYQWAWRQVQPLVDVFRKDKEFQGQLQAMLIQAGLQKRLA